MTLRDLGLLVLLGYLISMMVRSQRHRSFILLTSLTVHTVMFVCSMANFDEDVDEYGSSKFVSLQLKIQSIALTTVSFRASVSACGSPFARINCSQIPPFSCF